jgi:hypothetical protein
VARNVPVGPLGVGGAAGCAGVVGAGVGAGAGEGAGVGEGVGAGVGVGSGSGLAQLPRTRLAASSIISGIRNSFFTFILLLSIWLALLANSCL